MREVGLYECDGGSLLVGNENARVAISNRKNMILLLKFVGKR